MTPSKRPLPLTDNELGDLFARLPNTSRDDLGWQDHAACSHIETTTGTLDADARIELFFPDVSRTPEKKRYVVARQVCDGCKVWLDCLAYWLVSTNPTQDRTAASGFVGRTTPEDRVTIRRRWRQTTAAA